ncbi:MAG: FtsX-like permease family protein [Ruminococcus sp.]|nr:FtsX-like permease family protein [Ruminococcus sp.]
MGKITRLSLANIKKHKFEFISLLTLVMVCMLLVGSSLGAIWGIRNIFPNVMEKTGSYENYIFILEKNYNKEYENILKQHPEVETVTAVDTLWSMNTGYIDKNGKESALYMAFITADNEAKISKSPMDSTLSSEEIAAIEHPIYAPYILQDSMGYKAGDTFDITYGTRKFSFTIAGFYETMIFNEMSSGLKMIVSEKDYHILSGLLPKYKAVLYNDNQGQGGHELMDSFLEECEDYSRMDIKSGLVCFTYGDMKLMVTSSAELLLNLMIVMAVIIFISVVVIIRYRIANDIKEQIVNIGILEALGFTSKEITLSYVIEYLIMAAGGVLIGTGGCFLLTPVLLRMGELISAHRGCGNSNPLMIFLTGIVILVLVGMTAFIRARMVRKYPPVQAFRKGQGDHRFGREFFPLRKTKYNVHLRLALKGFFQNFKQNIGLTICITISALTVVISFIISSFFGDGLNTIASISGIEMSDLRLEIMPYADGDVLADELEEMPEIRKATPSSGFNTLITISDFNEIMFPVAFSSFDETENIFPMEGRFPEHDNEIMLNNQIATVKKIKVGDSLTLEYLNVKKSYLVTGIVTSVTNGNMNLYITEDGMKRINPTYKPDVIEVYLEEGIDAQEFRKTLTEKYGRSLSDAASSKAENGTYEERIRAEAEQQIAELMASNGATHIEYSIQFGDTIISGNSSNFVVSAITNIGEIMRTQLGSSCTAIRIVTAVFMVISAVVVMIILFILMESAIRRDRREFGIMKGLGYTSRELMFQLACRIVPSAVFSVIIGTVIGVTMTDLLTSIIGVVKVNIPQVIVLDIVMLIFCFVCAYVGARKIKTISVYELMTE